MRPADWETVEEPLELARALASARALVCVVLGAWALVVVGAAAAVALTA